MKNDALNLANALPGLFDNLPGNAGDCGFGYVGDGDACDNIGKHHIHQRGDGKRR
jgi:hypothetical protein